MIKPLNIVTSNVPRELLRIAAQNHISVLDLDVKLNSIDTFVKKSDSEVIEMSDDDFKRYKEEESLRDNTIEFEQEYNVEITSKQDNYPFKNLITEVEFEENDTVAYLVIKKGSKLNWYDKLYGDFLKYITVQKLKSNIMLYLFDVDYKESIKQLVDVIEKVKTITFKEDKKILISKGFDKIDSIHAEICMTIEENNEIGVEDSEGKVDYANRGFLLSCVEGDELFEFSKPQQGKHGRTCKGNILEVEIVNLDAKPTFTTEDSIEVQDSFEKIKYLSTRSGYLVKKGNNYDVSNSIDVDEISFKTTGTINSDLDSEISINVIKNDPLEDAVEEGMHVKVQKLSITGSIGRNTQIEAREVSISGQTHNDSKIQCINADIGLHKGKIVGRKVQVQTLEGGEIIADTAIVKNAMRGTIIAKTIEIEQLGSHVRMEASDYIHVEQIRGEENKFIIDPLVNSGLDDTKEDNEAYFKKVEGELKTLLKAFKDSTLKLKKNLEQCAKVNATIIKNKNQGLKISETLIKNFKICKIMKVQYKNLKEDVEYKKDQYSKLKKKLQSSASNVFDAEIVVNEPIKGYNKIIYKLNNPQREIEINADESMNKKVFKLSEDVDGVLSIVNMD